MGILNLIDQYIQNSGLGNTTSGILGGSQPQGGLLSGSPVIPFNPTQNTLPTTQTPTAPIGDQSQNWKVGLGQQNPYSFALSQMGDIIGGWGKTPLQQSETLKNRADANLANAQSQTKGQPFSGDNFDSQLVRQRAGEYVQAGVPLQEAYSRASNDVLQTKQQFVPNPDGSGSLVPVGRSSLPPISANVPQGTSQGQPIVSQNGTPQPLGTPGVGGQLLAGPGGQPSVTTNNPGMAPPPVMGGMRITGMPAVDVAGAKKAAEATATNMANIAIPAAGDDNVPKMTNTLAMYNRALELNKEAPGGMLSGAMLQLRGGLTNDSSLSPEEIKSRNAYSSLVQLADAIKAEALKPTVGSNQISNADVNFVASAASFNPRQTTSEREAILNQLKDIGSRRRDIAALEQQAAQNGQMFGPEQVKAYYESKGIDYNTGEKLKSGESASAVKKYNPATGKIE